MITHTPLTLTTIVCLWTRMALRAIRRMDDGSRVLPRPIIIDTLHTDPKMAHLCRITEERLIQVLHRMTMGIIETILLTPEIRIMNGTRQIVMTILRMILTHRTRRNH